MHTRGDSFDALQPAHSEAPVGSERACSPSRPCAHRTARRPRAVTEATTPGARRGVATTPWAWRGLSRRRAVRRGVETRALASRFRRRLGDPLRAAGVAWAAAARGPTTLAEPLALVPGPAPRRPRPPLVRPPGPAALIPRTVADAPRVPQGRGRQGAPLGPLVSPRPVAGRISVVAGIRRTRSLSAALSGVVVLLGQRTIKRRRRSIQLLGKVGTDSQVDRRCPFKRRGLTRIFLTRCPCKVLELKCQLYKKNTVMMYQKEKYKFLS